MVGEIFSFTFMLFEVLLNMFMFSCCVDKEHIAALTFEVLQVIFNFFQFEKKNEKDKIQENNTKLKMLKFC